MCGIIGYVGKQEAMPILLEGLKRLEYRGYDSAGIAIINGEKIGLRRVAGKINSLEANLQKSPLEGRIGLGHTRWATHGEPSESNAHPHTDCKEEIIVVHNGIIENFAVLREELQMEGHTFRSETDTEVIPHLIEKYYEGNLEEAVRKTLQRIQGTYGLGIVCKHEPKKLIAARNGSPLVLGLGKEENFLASDIPAILKHTNEVSYLEDREIAILEAKKIQISNLEGKRIEREKKTITWNAEMAEKNGFAHFMLKEINEQPKAVTDTLRGRLDLDKAEAVLGGLNLTLPELLEIDRIIITACGTSWHAGMIGKYLLEEFVRIPVEVENAAEFRYRNAIFDRRSLVIVISQSGETADTLAAMKKVQAERVKVIAICNVVGSSIAREADGGIFTHAGPEIGVASTKAFTAQIAALFILTLYLGRIRKTISSMEARKMIEAMQDIPQKMEAILREDEWIKKCAEAYFRANNALYLGRGYNYPIALEGALKLKEISYVHAEGYPAAEMKHGPIALIDWNMPVVVIAPKDKTYDKILGNIEEVKARGGDILAVATQGDEEIKKLVNHVIYIPETEEYLTPFLTVVPLQLLAYYIAIRRNCNVDQPRNLAKSVTVE
ncbi:MAG: glutamine--fructose-6-phosphate transaminase (isomerizing) [Candidatus Edwardsbacteria bacterium]